MKMSCLPEGVNWNNKEFTKEMLDYMRAVYCMHPMVLDALDYIDSIESRIAELEEKLAELVEAVDKMCDVTEDILEGDTVEMIYCRGIAEEARDVLKGA
jgi:predicted nuclease with RNAse H fold